MKLIENKIDEIYEILTNYNEKEIGLLSGLSGINLFLYQYYQLKNFDFHSTTSSSGKSNPL